MKPNKMTYRWTLGLTAAGCAGFTQAGDPPTDTASLGNVQKITLTDHVEASGKIQADQQAQLYWKTSGTVAEVLVQAGDFVQAGFSGGSERVVIRSLPLGATFYWLLPVKYHS